MPNADSDFVNIISVSRSGTNNLKVSFKWRDGITNEVKADLTAEWLDVDDMKRILDEQDVQDVIRAFVAILFRKDNGAFRQAFFDGMAGKTYRINQNVTLVTP